MHEAKVRLSRGVFRGGARGARAPPSASSPVLINSILGTTGSTAGLFNGCSTSVLSNPACISYLLTYYVLESRHRLASSPGLRRPGDEASHRRDPVYAKTTGST